MPTLNRPESEDFTGETETLPDGVFEKIKALILKNSSLDLGCYKEGGIRRRIGVRVRTSGCSSAEEYLRILIKDDREFKRLFSALTINVTRFFRNPETFEKIREVVLPALFSKKPEEQGASIRIWCIGCSTGEEPYSLAMILREYFKEELSRFSVTILATDVDKEVLRIARSAVYPAKALSDVPAGLRKRFFESLGAESFGLCDGIREMVTFKKTNILKSHIYGGFELIFCRNILIYLTSERRERILASLETSLVGGGYLVLGGAESMAGPIRGRFCAICPTERIYQKIA